MAYLLRQETGRNEHPFRVFSTDQVDIKPIIKQVFAEIYPPNLCPVLPAASDPRSYNVTSVPRAASVAPAVTPMAPPPQL